MSDNSIHKGEIDEKTQALLSNANAARLLAQTIEGTIGPKGLDIMMVGNLGDVVISNDGVTILKLMAVNHPAARMIINAARAQQERVGDGTTTATILAGTLVAEGANQVMKGVPVTQVIEGIKLGVEWSVQLIEQHNRSVASVDDPILFNVAVTAGRDQRDIAGLVLEGARIVGRQKLLDPDYRFCDAVVAREGAVSQVFMGTVVNRSPLNKDMPRILEGARILVLDDALAPEDIDNESRHTEAGFLHYLENKKRYEGNLRKICAMGVNMVLADRSIDDIGEQIFTEAHIMAVQRVSRRELDTLCKHTGARKLKRNGLSLPEEQLNGYLGRAARVQADDKLGSISVREGGGLPQATVLVGAATEEVAGEKERIARDAAAAVQAALQKGIVPGGGAIEVWTARQLDRLAGEVKGMAAYGVQAVKEALLRPFACIAANAGFNPLEKISQVIAEQNQNESNSITLDCDDGSMIDAFSCGIVDPSLIKIHALKTAGEVAAAILRINTIIKMKDGECNTQDSVE
ncbi:MAG: TCP-1/cpn60 chaperonin family protein [Syntrophomonadaceae bacterium]